LYTDMTKKYWPKTSLGTTVWWDVHKKHYRDSHLTTDTV
jgi:hypothetical protein